MKHIEVAVPTPLHRTFTYLTPDDLQPGQCVLVPLTGKRPWKDLPHTVAVCTALAPPQRLLLPVFGFVLCAGSNISTVSFSINSALAVATIMLLGGGGVIDSK